MTKAEAESATTGDVTEIQTRALRDGRREGIDAVIRALATAGGEHVPHVLQANKWLLSPAGERAIDSELKRADEERARSVLRGR